MSIQPVRLNLTSASFPLISTNIGRSGFTRMRDDTNYVITNQYSGSQADRDIGIPMPMYMHNVIPTTQGLKSVGYEKILTGLRGIKHFDKVIMLRSKDERKNFFVPAGGRNYILGAANPTNWTSFQFPALYNGQVTHAYINGRTFVCYERMGVFEYDPILNNFTAVPFNGIVSSGFFGITNANNYLIAWDANTVYWSSAIDATEFTPSLSTTSGSGKVQSARGAIVCCLPIHDGFIVYTTANAVAVTFTGNARFPWAFRELPGSAGIANSEHVTYDANYDSHFAWTTSGMMELTKQKATPIWPEVTDFLTERYYETFTDVPELGREDYDFATAWSSATQHWEATPYGDAPFVQRFLVNPVRVKMNFLGTRYITVSYGPEQTLTHVLVYDVALQRWGKLKIYHSDIFQWVKPNLKGGEIEPRRSFGILSPNGAIRIVDFDEDAIAQDSVLLYGKLMGQRGKRIQLSAIEVENIRPESNFTIRVLPSTTGKTYERQVVPLRTIAANNFSRYQCRTTGVNHCLLATGQFNLNTLQIEYTLVGGR